MAVRVEFMDTLYTIREIFAAIFYEFLRHHRVIQCVAYFTSRINRFWRQKRNYSKFGARRTVFGAKSGRQDL